jgi:predicted Zn-ribbon and HTH transcriptional regulator
MTKRGDAALFIGVAFGIGAAWGLPPLIAYFTSGEGLFILLGYPAGALIGVIAGVITHRRLRAKEADLESSSPRGLSRRSDSALFNGVAAGFAAIFILSPICILLLRRIDQAIVMTLLLTVATTLIVARVAYKKEEALDWVDEGKCTKCGYDIRGIGSGRCPECGNAISSSPRK